MSVTFNDQQKKLAQLTSKVDKSIRLQKIQLTDEQEKEIELEDANAFKTFEELCKSTVTPNPYDWGSAVHQSVKYQEIVLSKKLQTQACSHLCLTEQG